MYPRTAPGAILLLDRHYNSLAPYRKTEANIYAIRKDGSCKIGYVEALGHQLMLRPHNLAHPIDVITLADGEKPGDHIVGRVCHIATDT